MRGGARGRVFNVVDLVDKLEAEARGGNEGLMADRLCRLDFVVLDKLGSPPFAHQKGPMGLGIRTIGIARANVAVTLANIGYNMKRWCRLDERAVPA